MEGPPLFAGVNPDGSYSESLPIEVPAGRNGVQPKLSLSYNSNGGNGIVGVGWSLQGLPVISRINYGRGINYDGQDTFSGPEGRLIDVSASASAPAGSIFHAENEAWSKYEPLGWDGNILNGSNRCGDSACSWRITDRSGVVSLYGDAGTSRVVAINSSGTPISGGAVRVWALTRITDLNGNYYEVEYFQDAGQFYPKKITYTLGNWASRFYAVTFAYEKNNRPDKEIDRSQSALVQTNWRMQDVQVTYRDSCLIFFTCSDQVRRYALEFDQSPSTNRTRLTRVIEFDSNDENPINLISLQYSGSRISLTFESQQCADVMAGRNHVTGDFNGDGKTDLAGYSGKDGIWCVVHGNGGVFDPQQCVDVMGGRNHVVADFNGDGKSDLAGFSGKDGIWCVAHGNASTFDPQQCNDVLRVEKPLVGDFNGDGKADMAGFSGKDGIWCVVHGNASTFDSQQCVDVMAGRNHVVGDFNGDGKMDLAGYSGKDGIWCVVHGNASAFDPQQCNDVLRVEKPLVGDFDGDGKTDMAGFSGKDGIWCVVHGNASTFDSQQCADVMAGRNHVVGDFNDDGKMDLAGYSGKDGIWCVVHGNAIAFDPQHCNDVLGTETPMVGDFNGDGKTDMAGFSGKDGIWCVVHGEGDKNYDRVASITNSTGAQTNITYTLSTETSGIIIPGFSAYPIIADSSPRHLVTELKITNDRNLDNIPGNDAFVTNYEYYNGRFSTGYFYEKTSLGFETVRKIEANSGNYSITTYRQDKPFHGLPSTTRSYLANGEITSEKVSPTPELWLCEESGCTLDPTNNPNPSLSKQIRTSGDTISRQYINGIQALVTRQQIASYDNYGNPTETQMLRQLGSSTFIEHNYATYLNSLGDATHARVIGLRTAVRKCVEDCSLFNTSEDEEYYYDSQPLGQIGLTRLFTSSKSKIGGTVLTKSMTYFANGNLQSESNDAGSVKSFLYDDHYGQYIKETRLTVPNQSPQITTQVVDVRYGIVIESTDIYGIKAEIDLDASGRITEQRVRSGINLLRRTSFEYHITGNANSTDHYLIQCTHRKSNPIDTGLLQKDCSYTYSDALGRKFLKITTALNGTTPAFAAVHTKYDNQGRITHESEPYFKDETSSVGSPEFYIETKYDTYGRVWQQISADGKKTQTDLIYGGGNILTTQTKAEDGTVREYATDVRGLTTHVTEAKGTAVESTVSYTYNTNGSLWQVSAPQGLTVIDYYTDTKQQKSITDPNTGTTQYTYENSSISLAYGKLLVETRPAPNGTGTISVVHEYSDPYGRLTKQTFSTGDETLFTYDETDVSYGKNRLTTNEYKTQGYSYKQRHGYDELGQETTTTTDITKPGETLCASAIDLPCHAVISTFFDEQGRKAKIIYPDLKETVISYYGGSPNVASIAHDGKIYASYDGYDARAKVTGVHYGNGTRTQYTYTPSVGLMQKLQTLDSQNRAIQDLDYTFTDRRNIEDLSDNIVVGGSYHYEYDELNRVRKATRADGKIFNYAFDEKGNLTLKENRTQTYNPNSTKLQYSDLLTNSETIRTHFTWSASGNLLQRSTPTETINYIWSAQNFLIESIRVGGPLNGATTTNVYAGEANRFLRVYGQPGKQKVKTWDLGGMEIRETWSGTTRDNVQVTKYVYGIDGSRIASLTGNPGDLMVAATSSHEFLMAKLYNSQNLAGLTAKAPHLFMGAYYSAKEFYDKYCREILIGLLLLTVLLIVYLSHTLKPIREAWEFAQRFSAMLVAISILNAANCTSGKNDPTFINPTYPTIYGVIPDLYTGLPTGTVYYHGNHLGSSTIITDAAGLEKIRIHYTTYGEIDENLSGRWDFATNTLVHDAEQSRDAYMSIAYTGQNYSVEEEMYYYGARHYDSAIGTFISADYIVPEVSDPLAYNRFMYVRGNPVMYTDPTGHFWPLLVLMAAAFILGGTNGNPFKAENWKNFKFTLSISFGGGSGSGGSTRDKIGSPEDAAVGPGNNADKGATGINAGGAQGNSGGGGNGGAYLQDRANCFDCREYGGNPQPTAPQPEPPAPAAPVMPAPESIIVVEPLPPTPIIDPALVALPIAQIIVVPVPDVKKPMILPPFWRHEEAVNSSSPRSYYEVNALNNFLERNRQYRSLLWDIFLSIYFPHILRERNQQLNPAGNIPPELLNTNKYSKAPPNSPSYDKEWDVERQREIDSMPQRTAEEIARKNQARRDFANERTRRLGKKLPNQNY